MNYFMTSELTGVRQFKEDVDLPSQAVVDKARLVSHPDRFSEDSVRSECVTMPSKHLIQKLKQQAAEVDNGNDSDDGDNLVVGSGDKRQRNKQRSKKPKTGGNRIGQSSSALGASAKYPLLQFDCQFESGNIGMVKRQSATVYDATIRGDTKSERHRIWFYFRIRKAIKDQRVTIHVSNYSKGKAQFREGFTPIVRSKSKPAWVRLPSYCVSYFKCSRHNNGKCFTFSFVFDNNNDEYFFAYSYPYTYTYLQKFLREIEAMKLPYVKRQLLCRTVQQRRVDCLTIAEPYPNTPDSNTTQQSRPYRPAIVLSARVHPGETPASYVCHGIIEFLISNHPTAKFLRENVTIFIIPFLNPDGVHIGNYRCTSLGFDLNRQWQNPNFREHPTISAMHLLLRRLDISDSAELGSDHSETVANPETNTDDRPQSLLSSLNDAPLKLDYYMDLHAHTNAMDGFLYCNQSMEPPIERAIAYNDLTTLFPRLLTQHCPEFAFQKSKFCDNPKKGGSARRAMEAILSNSPICYTFEVSFYRSDYGNVRSKTYTKETFRNIGRCMIQSFADIYSVPINVRHDLTLFRVKTKKFMRGDARRINSKTKQQNNISVNVNVKTADDGLTLTPTKSTTIRSPLNTK